MIFTAQSVYAQKVSIPDIPTVWPVHTHNAMNQSRAKLIEHQNKYDEKVIKWNEKCTGRVIPRENTALILACQTESNDLDVESDIVDKEKDQFMKTFHDNERIYAAYKQSKENEEKLYPNKLSHPGVSDKEKTPFGEPTTPKNPDLNDINADVATEWGGRTGNAPELPKDLNYGNRNSVPPDKREQNLAKKYPAFNEILVNENKLKAEDTRIKNEGTTLYQQIKAKGTAATKEDWDKLKKITDDLNANKENLKKIAEQKEKAKNDYSVSDPF
jgi:hypothetical protein